MNKCVLRVLRTLLESMDFTAFFDRPRTRTPVSTGKEAWRRVNGYLRVAVDDKK